MGYRVRGPMRESDTNPHSPLIRLHSEKMRALNKKNGKEISSRRKGIILIYCFEMSNENNTEEGRARFYIQSVV